MNTDGWIKLHRELIVSDLWLSEPFTRGQAWVDLISIANYEEGSITIRGNRIGVARGQVGWSQDKLAQRWQWSRGKTGRFLDDLQNDHRIVQQTVRQTNIRFSLISICNYEKYQNKRATDDTTDDTQNGTTDGALIRSKEVKNINTHYVRTKIFQKPTLEELSEYCRERGNTISPAQFFDHYEAKGWMLGNTKMKDWKAAVRTWEGMEWNKPQKSPGQKIRLLPDRNPHAH